MDDQTPLDGQRILVVHNNPIVREDLREILATAGLVNVTLRIALSTDDHGPYDVAFVSLSKTALSDGTTLDWLRSVCRTIILLNSFLDAGDRAVIADHWLVEPFRTEDVLSVLARADLLRRPPAP